MAADSLFSYIEYEENFRTFVAFCSLLTNNEVK